MLKFPVKGRIVTIRSTILTPTECTTIEETPKYHAKKADIRYKNFKVAIDLEFSDQEITIGGTISIKARTKLCTLLNRNLHIFAWQSSDMTRVPQSIAEHRLNIQKGYSPVRQKKWGQAPKRAKAIQVEVQKLVEAGILRVVYYHDWLSNPIMVKKHDSSWRMCVDFTYLNKACLQDCYPISEIDWKVESLCGYLFKCFLDAYKGYHQLQMAEQDEEKTTFHTSHGRHSSDTGLFFKPSAANSRAKLYPNGKASPGASLHSQEAAQILPGASHREHNITYRPRTSVKGQILADFLVEKPNDAPPEASMIETP
nr:reverse transcriptase domain-containing protein [Tanacetum cinerariifolium]